MPRDPRIPELLAPAGNIECLHAAVDAGADAVYLGLDEFNARRNADNFTLENLGDACDYAHLRGTAVYVTMNVEIMPSELSRSVSYAQQAYQAGADAFIIQDTGLAAELARTLPQAELHASTQMNIHNAAGIEVAAQLGMSRVTLARELSIAEIKELAELASDFGMDVECFAHGALCVCYSGQCLMSSMIGGRSANRGLCAQACRLPYELHCDGRDQALPAEGEHLLSPRDLCSLSLLGDLTRAGVSSLKIEGRMKSADYVHEVVSVYRDALDEWAEDHDAELATPHRQARLAEAFSRGFTTAYLEGKRGNDIMSYGRPNNRGVFVGRVTQADHEWADIAPEVALNDGDILEFWTNRGHFAATVPAGAVAGKRKTVRIPVDQRTSKGDRVFRVRNASAAFNDDSLEPRIPVAGFATLIIGQPAHIRFIAPDGTQGEAWGDVVEPARTAPVSTEDVRSHIDRLGQMPYTLSNLEINLSEGAGIGFSKLHCLRTAALEALTTELLAPYHTRGTAVESAGGQNDAHDNGRPPRRERSCAVMAWASNPSCARAARRGGADEIYIPALNFRRGQAQLCGARQGEAEQAGYPKRCIIALSTIDHDPLPDTREGSLSFDPWDYVREGKTVFADSLASAIRAINLGARVELGPHVPLTNRAALQYASELGVKRVWLSPELTLGQIADLAESSPVELGLFISGAQELMICEHCLLMSQGPCAETCETCNRRDVRHHLVDRKGFEFPVVTDLLGRSHLYNGIELDAVPALPDLIDVGISAVMVDTTLMTKKEAESAVARASRAVNLAIQEHRSVGKRPNTTTGHLFRGVM